MPGVTNSSGRLTNLSPNTLGAVFMIVGSIGYVTNDALIRAATEEGLDVYQALFLRGVAMSVLFAAIVQRRGDRLARTHFTGPLVGRVAAELAGTALFFAALVRLEFANAQTILLLVPFAVTLTAAIVLRERVTIGQYAAVVAGFGGVLLVVQPATEGFSIWSLAVVASAGFLTLREFATRRVPNAIPAPTIALITAMGLTVLTGAISAGTGWNTITLRAALLVLLACLCLVVGYIFTIQTVRVGDLSVSAPFRYTTLLGAVVLGSLLFDEIPDAVTIAGCLVIVTSGIYAIRLERRAGRGLAG
ncbi:MAG: DMT family transporter [Ilumatobacteraceae bacterium]